MDQTDYLKSFCRSQLNFFVVDYVEQICFHLNTKPKILFLMFGYFCLLLKNWTFKRGYNAAVYIAAKSKTVLSMFCNN